MTTHVTEMAAAPSELAIKHFQDMLAFETDCWDVHESLKSTIILILSLWMCAGRAYSERAT
jgi:hypothetical protein